jgi:hypothetical protein
MLQSSIDSDRSRVIDYVESQLADESVLHAERIGTQVVLGLAHETWNVVTDRGRWWVVTNPTNLYTQDDFKSADVVLSFHIGLMARISSRNDIPVSESAASMFTEVWRNWEQATDALSTAVEAEDFQAVGMRLREAYVALLKAIKDESLVSADQDPPQDANPEWLTLLGNHIAGGNASSRLRSYLKSVGGETWSHVNWLTHATNAVHMDAEIACANVSHLISVFTASLMRWHRGANRRCAICGSYRIIVGGCDRCGWYDDRYIAPELPVIDEAELARRLAEPCTPSSDISTFDGPKNYR